MLVVKLRALLLAVFYQLILTNLVSAADMEITPFRIVNQSPLTVIHPLPVDSSSVITPRGKLTAALTFDLANSYINSLATGESLLLDGESARWTLLARYGLTDAVEVGVELPWITAGGGFLDSFISDWHDTFGMPQGGREIAHKNRLNYSYTKNGSQKLSMNSSGSGVGDVVLTGGVKLYEEKTSALHDSVAFRSTVKLPSGDSDYLRGSGAVGGSISLNAASSHFTEYGTLGLFGSVGALLSAKGDVLKEQQEQFAGFGTVGLGWGAAPWISFKVQLNANTRLYKHSALAQISQPALMLVSGGAVKLPGDYTLDIGVSEDVSVGTAPDVALHLGLSRTF